MGIHADAQVAWLDGYVEDVCSSRVAPVQRDLEVAQRQVADLGAALSGANAEVGRLTAENAELDAANDDIVGENNYLNVEVQRLRRRIAELENPKPAPFVFAAAVNPRSSDGGDRAKAWLRLRDGIAQHGGNLTGVHTFSGVTIPSRFGLSGDNATLTAIPTAVPVVNVKTPGNDVAGAASGKYDVQFVALLDSWPADRGGWLTIDHEPENPDKGINAEQFRQAWARYARLFLAHPVSKRVTFAACFMGWTWQKASGRTPTQWDPLPLLSEDERKRVVLAADIYFRSTETAEKGWADRAQPFFDYAKANGYRTAVFETALNNDTNRTPADCAATLKGIGERYRTSGVEMVAYYEATGPAAGTNAWIDSDDELAALATWA